MDNDIIFTRGDTVQYTVELYDGEEAYILQDGDKLVFTVKENVYTKEIVMQKEILNNQFTIDHKDTESLSYGDYVYDVQLTFANGDIQTVIKPTLFRLTEEVNFGS